MVGVCIIKSSSFLPQAWLSPPRYASLTLGLFRIASGSPVAITCPCARTEIRSTRLNTTCISCSIMILVIPRCFIFESNSIVRGYQFSTFQQWAHQVAAILVSELGSSPTQAFFCPPLDRLPAWWWSMLSILRSNKMLSASWRRLFSDNILLKALKRNSPSLLEKAKINTFWRIVRSWKTSGVWNTRTIPPWLISWGCFPVINWPSNTSVPVSGISLPIQTFRKVDLPAPSNQWLRESCLQLHNNFIQGFEFSKALVDTLDV